MTFFGTYYGGEAWSQVDRLAIRVPRAPTKRGLSKRSIARARCPPCVGSTGSLSERSGGRKTCVRAVGTPKLERYLPSYLDRAQIDLVFQAAEVRAWEGS